MRLRNSFAICLGLVVAAALPALAQVPEVAVNATPEYASVRPGDTFRVALHLAIPQGWHIYWINPGPAGLPTTLAWRLSPDVSGGASEWPYPETDESGGIVTNVYRRSVVVFSTFTALRNASGDLSLSAHLVWGLCQVECVRQERSVEVRVPVSSRPPRRTATWSEAVAAVRFLPIREPGARLTAVSRGGDVHLELRGLREAPTPGSWVTWFPVMLGAQSTVTQVRRVPGGIAVTTPRAAAPSQQMAGVLVPAHAPGASAPMRAIAVDAPIAN